MNKIELILKEVERYKKVIGDPLLSDDDLIIGERNACNYIIKLINSLPEEPSKVWHDTSEEPVYNKDSKNCNQIVVYGGDEWEYSLSVCSMIDEDTIYAPITEREYIWGKCPFTKWAYAEDLLNLQEEPSNHEYELSQMAIEAIDRKRVCPTLKGDALHKFKNEWNTIKQILHWWETGNLILNYRLALHWAAWGAHNLKDLGTISGEERLKLDIQEEPVSEDLEKAAVEAFKNIVDEDRNSFLEIFKAGAQWKEQQILKSMDLGEPPYLISVEQAYYRTKKLLEE